MASNAIIGALRVVIGADTGALEKGLKSAEASVTSFGKSLSTIAAGVGLEHGIEGIVSNIVHALKEAINHADELGKAAQKIGIPVEELSGLKHAAELADVSFQTLTQTMGKFNKGLSDAAQGVDNDFAKAIKALELDLKDASGEVKTQSQLLAEIADKMASFADGANKARLLMALFGKAGAELAPLLNEGADGLRKANDEVKAWGLAVTQEGAQKAQDFNDNLRRLNAMIDGLTIAFTQGLVDSLSKVTGSLVTTAGNADTFSVALDGVRRGASSLSSQFIEVAINVANLGREWKVVWEFLTANDIKTIKAKWVEWGDVLKENEAQVIAATAKYNEFAISWEMLGLKAEAAGKKVQEATKPQAPGLPNDQLNALQQFIQSTEKSTEKQIAQAEGIGKSTMAQTQLLVITEALRIAEEKKIPVDAAALALIQKTADAAGLAATQLAGVNIIQNEGLSPAEKYNEELARLNERLTAAGATTDQFARAQENLKEKFGMTWTAMGANIASTMGQLSQLTATFGKENKALLVLSKALGIGQAIINTQIGITKAMATFGPGTPMFFAAAALAVATGAAAIAAIAAQGLAQGGTFRVPGGSSGRDNTFVPLNLAAGEQVDITPASEAAAAGPSNVTIDMRGDQPFFSRAVVERMLNAMHTVLEDGHQVQLVVMK